MTNRFVLTLAACFGAVTLGMAAAPVQAAVMLDQDALVSPTATTPFAVVSRFGDVSGTGPFSVSVGLVQTATAGLTGYLDHIDLQIARGAGSGLLVVTLFDGNFLNGISFVTIDAFASTDLSASTTAALNQTSLLTFDVRSANYFVTAGQQFSIGLEFLAADINNNALAIIGSGPPNVPGTTPVFNYNDYAGGELIRFVNGVQQPLTPARDIGFRSFVDVTPGVGGIPEPATWAMMIIGFCAIGSAMRRRPLRIARAA